MDINIIHKNSRAFNEVVIDKNLCKVYKRSSDVKKLKAEKYWYEHIPESLQGFVPKVVSFSESSRELILDYCPYSTLSELYTSNIPVNWARVLTRILDIYDCFKECTSEDLDSTIRTFHIEKTRNRVSSLMQSDEFWQDLLTAEEIVINSVPYKNLNLDEILQHFSKLQKAHTGVVHGDYCLSNIMYDLNTDAVKLIDPRGYLLSKDAPTIYGDSHYDYAKLMHSIHGLYDFIVQGKYSLISLKKNSYSFDLPFRNKELYLRLVHILDSRSREEGTLEYRRLLEVLLFLTMIPLHFDDHKRQVAFYLRAVQLYHEFMVYINI